MISKEEDFISIKELSKILSVSEATVKNWIKLNKIKPDGIKNSAPLFTTKYARTLVKQLNSKDSTLLKTRRNKRYATGNFFYKDYISSNSKNLDSIITLSDYIKSNLIELKPQEIEYIIADCAIQLLIQSKNIFAKIKPEYLKEYLSGNIQLGIYTTLIDDLIDNKDKASDFIKKYPEIFETEYICEKNEDILGLLYLSLSNIKDRKARGAYYTPNKIVQKIINETNISAQNTVLDPCCGAGNFLLHLPDNLKIEQVYGNDIDPVAVKIARINMALKFPVKNIEILYKNITNKNFLLDDRDQKFDYIIGNPPWGADFSSDIEIILRHRYRTAQNKNIESYDVFVEKALATLKENGDLLFVLPEAILSVKSHKAVRAVILENNSIKYLEFIGNIFNKVQCPSIILKIKHTGTPLSCIGTRVITKDKIFVIKQGRDISPVIFNFSIDDKEYKILQKLYNGNKAFLKNNALFALGIVTGDNKKYLTDKKTKNNEAIVKGSDIEKFIIKEPENYIKYEPEKFQQVAPDDLYREKEKLFYKFISNKLIFAYDNKQRLSLNSCNILIPKIWGMRIKYILAVLNSRIAQFIFEKKFNSVKVLRSHIENIPIPVCDNETQFEIIKIVDRILTGDKPENSSLYEQIEDKIRILYNLTTKEYNTVKNAI